MLGWELPPYHSGGLGVACFEMCKELATSGVDIDFVLPYVANFDINFMNIVSTSDQSVEEFQLSGGGYSTELYKSKNSDFYMPSLDLSKQHDLFAHNVAKIAKYSEFDIIHAHDWLTFKAGLMAKAISGKPLIAHVHATQYDHSGGSYGNPEIREIEQAGLMQADQIFAVSQYTKEVLMREYSIPQDKISVVHNSVSFDPCIDETTNLHGYLQVMKANAYKVVINIGRKTLQKGLTHLLEAAKKVIDKNPKVLFLLAGGGDQENELIMLAANLGISKNFISAEWLNGKALRDTFKIADVFVMPSVSEPFGLVALEAVSYGTPILVSKQSGVSEVLKNCLKVDFWDTDEMADMILSLIENDALAKTMLASSTEELKKLSWSSTANLMINHYDNVTGEYNG